MEFLCDKTDSFLDVSYRQYKLSISLTEPNHTFGVHFSTPICRFVTCRDIKDYKLSIRNHNLNPELQYVEVGAGLGEFTPHLLNTFDSKLKYKPIVIDPIDYSLIGDLVSFSLSLDLNEKTKLRLERILSRCSIILDNNKVNLINSKLQDAIFDKNLLGIADVVVDNAGASSYGDIKNVFELEESLLNSNGILLSQLKNPYEDKLQISI